MTAKKETKIGNTQWARFEDWISDIAGKHRDWTIVAEIEDYSGVHDEPFTERKATLSYLASNSKDSMSKAFELCQWDIHFDIGDVSVENTDKGIVCTKISAMMLQESLSHLGRKRDHTRLSGGFGLLLRTTST